MNKVILMGRLTKDPELGNTPNQKTYAKFTLAVNRRFKDSSGNYPTDFISCTAWGNTADFAAKYFVKGSMAAVVGSIQTGSYEKDGKKIYTTEVNVGEIYFTGEKRSGASQMNALPPGDDFADIPPEYLEEELPF